MGVPAVMDGMMSHPVDNLAQSEFNISARYSCTMLARHGFVWVALSPGDGTKYVYSIVRPPTREQEQHAHWNPDAVAEYSDRYMVATHFGPLYEWLPSNGPIHPDYVHEKWNRSGNVWSSRVLARFLDTLGVMLLADDD